MTTASTSPITTAHCPRCESVAVAGQRFCRQCGYRFPTESATGDGVATDSDPSTENDRPGPTMRPVSRALIALIIVLFVVLGALAALLVDSIRSEPDQPPTTTAGAAGQIVDEASGTRPITSTD